MEASPAPVIRRCRADEIPEAGAFYDRVVKHMDETGTNYPHWTYKIYPSAESAAAAEREGSLYVCLLNGRICGAFVANAEPGAPYEKGDWSVELSPGEFMVIHSLAVDHELAGRGIGSAMVRFCIELARSGGFRGIRLDVVPGNVPAIRLYEKAGFTFAGDRDLERGLEGVPVFSLYEFNFQKDKT